jgi:hypothetical protein
LLKSQLEFISLISFFTGPPWSLLVHHVFLGNALPFFNLPLDGWVFQYFAHTRETKTEIERKREDKEGEREWERGKGKGRKGEREAETVQINHLTAILL